MTYAPQVDKSHYQGKSYRSLERWNSYWHQLDLVRALTPSQVLEIGPGGGVVTRELKALGIEVTTCDIAPDLSPDIVASVTALPVEDGSFDAVLAAEILEHIEFSDLPAALRELCRVSSGSVVISLPHPGYVFSLRLKVPLVPRIEVFFKVPFFFKTHRFNGEHYWELGKRGYPLSRFITAAREAGLSLVSSKAYADDPAHRFFVFTRV
jgi:ubiquinone/menaquinone biosynthesis C-methylase UbiE